MIKKCRVLRDRWRMREVVNVSCLRKRAIDDGGGDGEEKGQRNT